MSGNKEQAKEYSSSRLRKYFHPVEKALKQKKAKEVYCFHYIRYLGFNFYSVLAFSGYVAPVLNITILTLELL